MISFTCNICGAANTLEEVPWEPPTCSGCRSNVRMRALMYLLSIELYGEPRPLSEFPKNKNIKGFGLTDDLLYATPLAKTFDYTNTFYDREPYLDLTEPHPEQYGTYDFILSSDVFEHVAPPVERAFEEACRLLKPNGFLCITVPSLASNEDTIEYYPELHEYSIVELGGEHVLVNRRRDKTLAVHRDLEFHGGVGATLVMRLFSQRDLARKLRNCGFLEVVYQTESVDAHGIVMAGRWSLPLVARKERYTLPPAEVEEPPDILPDNPAPGALRYSMSPVALGGDLHHSTSRLERENEMDRLHEADYQVRASQELNTYSGCLQVHELPDIFHYWSNSKVRPRLETFGFSSPTGMFKKYLGELCGRGSRATRRFISIGSGNCDLEIDLARHLLTQGNAHFVIECLDMNPTMLERGRAAAEQHGVGQHIRGIQADFNKWKPECEYDAILAYQALHHVVNLEHLFKQIHDALGPEGLFLISDIVGRNGHQRWPEALQIVEEFWQELPSSRRFNRMLQRQEETYVNWDCSIEGFEGIRSQDILPLLLGRFHFQLFLAYGNVIDPFVDRAFGHNFDAAAEWDRNFIDRVHQRDEQEMLMGNIKPVHMEAVVGKKPSRQILFDPPFTPEFCVRWPDPTRPVVNIVEVPDSRVGPLLAENAALGERVNTLEQQLCLAADSRWLRFGNRLGLGPRLR